MKNLSDLKSQISFCDVTTDDVTKWAFWSCAVLTQKMENWKETLKTNTKRKSQLFIFYSLRDICNIPRMFLNKLWTLFVADC